MNRDYGMRYSKGIDDLLTQTLCIEWHDPTKLFYSGVKPMDFNHTLPFVSDFEDGYELDMLDDVVFSDLRQPFDSKVIVPALDNKASFTWLRLQSIKKPVGPGLFYRPARAYVKITEMLVNPDSGITNACVIYAALRAGKWGFLPTQHHIERQNLAGNKTLAYQISRSVADDVIHDQVTFNLSLQLTLEYEWSISVGYQGFPKIKIPTTPVGVRELLRFRDLPTGKKRRDALIHWVAAHYRTKRSFDPAELGLSLIREYLRGKMFTTMDGFEIEIHPSLYDLERARRVVKA